MFFTGGKYLKKRNFSTLKWRIFLLLALVATGYFIYIGIALSEYRKQASLLQDVQLKQYPIQSQLIEAILIIEKLQLCFKESQYNKNSEILDKFSMLSIQFYGNLSQVSLLDAGTTKKTNEVRQAFEIYYNDAYSYLESNLLDSASFENFEAISQKNESHALHIKSLLVEIRGDELKSSADDIADIADRADKAITLGILVACLGIVILWIFSWLLFRWINNRLQSMVTVLKNISQQGACLDLRIPVEQKDEMSELAFLLNLFIGRLQRLTKEKADEMHDLAYTDTVTKLPNRRFFNTILNKEIERCRREQNANLTVFFIDLDDFKNINDQFGHDAGDTLLCEVAKRLGDIIRASDILAYQDNGVVARMGGDEFMVLVSSLDNPRDASVIAERMRTAVCSPVIIDDVPCKVGVSIGIASFPYNGKTPEDLIINADTAMYEAKKRGKNSFCFFDYEIGRAAERSLLVEKRLRKAIELNKTEFYVQPKFNLLTGEMNGAELLLRWSCKELGHMTPDLFIPVAEKSNLIYLVDEWALDNACKLIDRWQQEELLSFPISVNISSKQAIAPNLITLVERCLQHHPLAHHFLELEITEPTTSVDFEALVDNIKLLQDFDVKIALDDFGAAHSSLTILQYCDIDTLKIDSAFVSEMEINSNARSIVEMVVDLSQCLGVEVIAEGVENLAQVDILKKANCHCAQGYLYAKPMPICEFEQLLRDHSRVAS